MKPTSDINRIALDRYREHWNTCTECKTFERSPKWNVCRKALGKLPYGREFFESALEIVFDNDALCAKGLNLYRKILITD